MWPTYIKGEYDTTKAEEDKSNDEEDIINEGGVREQVKDHSKKDKEEDDSIIQKV